MKETPKLVNFLDRYKITAAGAVRCIVPMTCGSVLSLISIMGYLVSLAMWTTHPVVWNNVTTSYDILQIRMSLLPNGWWQTSEALYTMYLPVMVIGSAIVFFWRCFDASKSEAMTKSNYDMRLLLLTTMPDMVEIGIVIVAYCRYDGFLPLYLSTNCSWEMMPAEIVLTSICLVVAICLTDRLTGTVNRLATRGVHGNATLRRHKSFGAQYLVTLMVIFALARWFFDGVNISRNMAWLQREVSAYDWERAEKNKKGLTMTAGYNVTNMYPYNIALLKQITQAKAQLPYWVDNLVSWMNDAGSIALSYCYIFSGSKGELAAHEATRSVAQEAKEMDSKLHKVDVAEFQQVNGEVYQRMDIEKENPQQHLVLGYLGVHNWKQVAHLLTSLIYTMCTLTNIWKVEERDKNDKETYEDKCSKHIRRTMWCTLAIRVLVVTFKYLLFSALSLITQRPFSVLGICIAALFVMLKVYMVLGLPSQDDPLPIRLLIRLFEPKRE